MQQKDRQLIFFFGGLFLFCLDRFLKYLTLYIYTDKHLILKIFGWNPFENIGIAFSFPVPVYITKILSVPILVAIIYFLFSDFIQNKNKIFLGLLFLFFGSLSNLIDRFVYGATIDYWLFGTGIINLADLLIAFGIYSLFVHRRFLYK